MGQFGTATCGRPHPTKRCIRQLGQNTPDQPMGEGLGCQLSPMLRTFGNKHAMDTFVNGPKKP
eukprot:6215608-Lingulodinium_polyedra.AAC.1